MDDQQGFSRAFLESQGRILVPDYDSHSQSPQERGPRPQTQKKRNNSGNSKSGKKSSKSNKQGQSTKLQTTQQPAVSSQSASAASTSSYTNSRWSSSWNHRSYGCQVAPTGSLLEEVLNEKKMALLKSPEVMEFLQGLQKDVQVKKDEELKTQADGGSIIDPSATAKQTAKRSQKRKKSSTRGQADKTPVTSGANSRQHSPGFDLGGQDPELVLFGRRQTEIPPSDERRAPNQGASHSDIWSKEASAFSTVTSNFPTNSS